MTTKINRCAACRSENVKDAYTEENLAIVSGNNVLLGPRTISVCKDCGIAYSSETIPPKAMRRIYAQGASGDVIIQKGTNINWFKLFEDRRDFVLRNIDMDSLPKNAKKYDICDVGCSSGAFLSAFDRTMWNLFGVDPNPLAWRESLSRLNIKIDAGYWEDIKINNEKFDLIVSSHVLEHCYSPSAFLQNCQKALREDGYLFIEVPDTQNAQWWSLSPYNPTHVIHFFIEALLHAVESVGITPIRWEQASPAPDCGVKDGVLRVLAKKSSTVRRQKIVVKPSRYIDIIRKNRVKTIKFSEKLCKHVATRLIEWAEQDKRIAIYGANHHSANLLLNIPEEKRRNIKLTAFLDTSASRIGYKLFGIHIQPFGSPVKPDCVLISCRNSEEAMAKHVKSAYPGAEICSPYREMEQYLSSVEGGSRV